MKNYALLFFLLVSLSGFGQNTINNYKYVLVPEKVDFLNANNQYGLPSQTKFLLEEKGFSVHFDNAEIPKELAGDRCNALKAEVVQRKSIFVTYLTLILKDCQGNIIFKSKEGKSREKEYAAAYNEALQDAFKSLKEVPYAYNGTVNTRPRQAVETAAAPVAVADTTTVTPTTKDAAETLYAQPTANGYQLVDTTPKIVLSLFRTSVADYFIAEKNASHGIVLKKNGEWFFEYYNNGKLMAEKLLIRF
jgi:hypothetical protein